MQQGLAHWQSFLADKPLPILLRTKTDVQALIDQAQLSIMQYAGPIVYDAGFSTHLFRYVNTQRQSSGKNPLTTMGNVLSHLGQAAFQKVLNQMPLLESLNLSEKNSAGYIRVMGQTCHAALQATQWAQQRHVVETEEMQFATLLQNITELMLWCYGDDVMPKIEEQCYVKKQSYEQAAKNVLGCGMRELGAALAEKWNLPEMATAGLKTQQNDFTLATGVSLASELARIVTINWYGKDATQIIQRIAKYKGKPEGEIDHVLHINAVNVNDVLIDKGYAAPAKLLFQLADDAYIDPQFILDKIEPVVEKNIEIRGEKTAAKPTAKSAEATQAERKRILDKIKARKRADNSVSNNSDNAINTEKANKPILNPPEIKPKTVANKKSEVDVTIQAESNKPENNKAPVSKELAAAIKEFQLMVAQARPAHDLIEQAVKACLLCGVQRSVFVIKLPEKDMLVSRYAEQVSDDLEIKNFKIPINKPHVFTLLMEKSRNLFLNKTNAVKYWRSVPETVKLAIGVKSFFAMSIFVNNHAMGLMYADKVKGELTQAEFVQFQGVCRLLSKGIIQSAQNKKNKLSE